mgnify:CR=1 FL=1
MEKLKLRFLDVGEVGEGGERTLSSESITLDHVKDTASAAVVRSGDQVLPGSMAFAAPPRSECDFNNVATNLCAVDQGVATSILHAIQGGRGEDGAWEISLSPEEIAAKMVRFPTTLADIDEFVLRRFQLSINGTVLVRGEDYEFDISDAPVESSVCEGCIYRAKFVASGKAPVMGKQLSVRWLK